MVKRNIIKIDENKCNGCGLCMPNCPEGAIQIIDGKARLVSDLFCDGLGACLGHCPEGAITIEDREAEEYSEAKVMENIVKQGKNTVEAHLRHLKEHGQEALLSEALAYLKERGIDNASTSHSHSTDMTGQAHSCPGSMMKDFREEKKVNRKEVTAGEEDSELKTWPVQIKLVPVVAPYFADADLLIAADCVPFAYADFHRDLLKDRILLVGCPKLDDLGLYEAKISQILKHNTIKSITYAHMEVPCCFGLVNIIKKAIKESGKDTPFAEVVISIKGDKL